MDQEKLNDSSEVSPIDHLSSAIAGINSEDITEHAQNWSPEHDERPSLVGHHERNWADNLTERRYQRWGIIAIAFLSLFVSFAGLGYIFYVQSEVRQGGENYREFTVLDSYQLELFITGVFAQVFLIIHEITKALWNDNDQDRLAKQLGIK